MSARRTVHPLAHPARFLFASCLAVAALLLVWPQVSGSYVSALVAIANAGLHLLGVPVLLNPPAPAAAALAYPEVVGIAALFACTPRRPVRWRFLWLGTVLLGLAALHAGLLVADAWQVHHRLAADPAGAALATARLWLPLLAGLAAWFAAVSVPDDES